MGDAEFAYFRDLLHARAGIALAESKRSLVAARLGRRLRALGCGSFADYRRFLENSRPSGSEMALMINCMTTNKTSFFREEQHFAVLRDRILEADQAGQEVYRIWSAGCSTGEEPYSIAMTALDAARRMEVRILASDLDTDVLARGQEAMYSLDAIAQMDDGLKRRYFLRGRDAFEGWVQVKSEARARVTFRHINLIAEVWPVQTHFDAIFCRNVIIYFDRQIQARLFGRLAPYLAPDGLLFIGQAETLFWLDDLLVPLDHSVYRLPSAALAHPMP